MTGNGHDVDAAFDLLSNRRRRLVLCLLARQSGPRDLRDLARDVVAADRGIDPDAVPEADYRSVYVSLYQNHVPRLADAGVLSYDPEARTVAIADSEATRRLLHLADAEVTTPNLQPYFLLLAASSLLAVGTTAGVLPSPHGPWGLPMAVLLVGGVLVLGRALTARRRPVASDCGEIETAAAGR